MNNATYTTSQLTWLVILRIAIGWHFLYEGLVKASNTHWSSYGYLLDSKGIFKDFFNSLANNQNLLGLIDFMNVWGLIAIGLALILGVLPRVTIQLGMVLLALFYLSHPAYIGVEYALPTEGSYFIINKTIIELFALGVLLAFPTSKIIGLERFFNKKQE